MTPMDKRAYEALVREQDRLNKKMLDILIFAKGIIPPLVSQADADNDHVIQLPAKGLWKPHVLDGGLLEDPGDRQYSGETPGREGGGGRGQAQGRDVGGLRGEGRGMNIRELQQSVHSTAVRKGWYEEERNPFELLFLVHSELSEAGEEIRNGRGFTEIYYDLSRPNKPEGVPIELADAVIRILDLCEDWGIDLEEAIRIKVAYNETRPIRHGGKLA